MTRSKTDKSVKDLINLNEKIKTMRGNLKKLTDEKKELESQLVAVIRDKTPEGEEPCFVVPSCGVNLRVRTKKVNKNMTRKDMKKTLMCCDDDIVKDKEQLAERLFGTTETRIDHFVVLERLNDEE
jgi:hypothetical protein